MVQKGEAGAGRHTAPKGPFELHQVFQPPFLTQRGLLNDTIEVNEIKPPLIPSILCDEKIRIAHVSGIQAYRMKSLQELRESAQECPSLPEGPVFLPLLPITIQRDLGEEPFAAIPTFSYAAGDAFLEHGEWTGDGKAIYLKELCSTPGSPGWRPVPQRIAPAAPGQ
jgi:hypothetical protein